MRDFEERDSRGSASETHRLFSVCLNLGRLVLSNDSTKMDPKPIKGLSMKFTKIFIDNEWKEAGSGKTFPVLDPATEKVIVEVAEGDSVDVDQAVKSARKAFALDSEWRKMDVFARAALINKLADLIQQEAVTLATIQSMENGKPFKNSHGEVLHSVNLMRFYAGACPQVSGKTYPDEADVLTMTRKEPVGVVAAIVPWNYPVVLCVMKLGPILAAGCTVVLKPAELTPLTGLYFGDLVKRAGFPPGVVNIVPGYGFTAGAALAQHPDVNKITFTGSTAVGKSILEEAGKGNLKRVCLELGGKSPLVVCNDADLAAAVDCAISNLFSSAGQTCIAPTRLFVQSKIYDQFVDAYVKRARAIKVGHAFDESSFYGPQIDDRSLRKILELIESGKSEGAKLETGGNRLGSVGYFVEPTVFSNVRDDMRIAREEIFGPVLSIFKFETLDEVIARANNTTYGLAAGIFTKDLKTAVDFSKRVEAGNVWVNQWGVLYPYAQFGGYKMSGIGRELGIESLESYMEVKTISMRL